MVNVRNVNKVPHIFWEQVKKWENLNDREQDLWEVLGYDQTTWEGNSSNVINKFTDFALQSPEEQRAILELGYDPVAWDEEMVDPIFPVKLFEGTDREVTVNNINDYWDKHKYDDLSPFQKRLFEILGKVRNGKLYYNLNLKLFDDLSVEQQHAVEFLGMKTDSKPYPWDKVVSQSTPVDLSFPVTLFEGTVREKEVGDILEYWGEHDHGDLPDHYEKVFKDLQIESSNWTTFKNAFKNADTILDNLDSITDLDDRKLVKAILTQTFDELENFGVKEKFSLLVLGLLNKVPTNKKVILSASVVKNIALLDSVASENDVMQLIKFMLN